VSDKFASASAITEHVLVDMVATDECVDALPTLRNTVRAGNSKRHKLRPREPKELSSIDISTAARAYSGRFFSR